MSFDLQNVLVLLVVVLAGGYLARMAWQTLTIRRAKACGACSNCSADATTPEVFGLEAPGKQNVAAASSDRNSVER